jgi:hypothetical protein
VEQRVLPVHAPLTTLQPAAFAQSVVPSVAQLTESWPMNEKQSDIEQPSPSH